MSNLRVSWGLLGRHAAALVIMYQAYEEDTSWKLIDHNWCEGVYCRWCNQQCCRPHHSKVMCVALLQRQLRIWCMSCRLKEDAYVKQCQRILIWMTTKKMLMWGRQLSPQLSLTSLEIQLRNRHWTGGKVGRVGGGWKMTNPDFTDHTFYSLKFM